MSTYIYRFLSQFIIYTEKDSYRYFCTTVLENLSDSEDCESLYKRIYELIPEDTPIRRHRIFIIKHLDRRELQKAFQIVRKYLDSLPLDKIYQLIGNLTKTFKDQGNLGIHITDLLITLRRHEEIKNIVKIRLFLGAEKIIAEY